MRPAIANINISNLIHNYRLLRERAGKSSVMAVVKSDAYGHGLGLVAPALFNDGCRHFAVTDAAEGAKARSLLPDAESIVLLSGVFDIEDAQIASEQHLTPVIVDEQQAQMLVDASFTGAVWVKVNTGMQRLGADNIESLVGFCRNHDIAIAGIMSHLACADAPEHPLNRVQSDEFTSLQESLTPKVPASLLNSAGMVSLPTHCFDVVRPGIALYGIEPVSVEPLGLKPVMQLTGNVIQIRHVEKGAGISYGASFTAPSDMSVAIVGLGYGDGLPRLLSNRGQAQFNGVRLPIVGRVCMDFCLLDCSGTDLKVGDSVEFWGEGIPADLVADSIGTIAYELFTNVNHRVSRKEV